MDISINARRDDYDIWITSERNPFRNDDTMMGLMANSRRAFLEVRPGTHIHLDGEPAQVRDIGEGRIAIFTGEHPNGGIVGTGCAKDSDALWRNYCRARENELNGYGAILQEQKDALSRISLETPGQPIDYVKWSALWEDVFANS